MKVLDCNNQVWQLTEIDSDIQLAIKIDNVGFEHIADFDNHDQALDYIQEASGGEPFII